MKIFETKTKQNLKKSFIIDLIYTLGEYFSTKYKKLFT